MEREEIIARVEAAIEALNSVGTMRQIETSADGRVVTLSAYLDGEFSIGCGGTVSEALDKLHANAARKHAEAADRAAFEAWRAERAAA